MSCTGLLLKVVTCLVGQDQVDLELEVQGLVGLALEGTLICLQYLTMTMM